MPFNKDRNGKNSGGGGGRNRSKGRHGRNNGNRNNKKFPKFADNDYRNRNSGSNYSNDSKYWSQNDWNNDVDTGIIPWHRTKPVIPLESGDNRQEKQGKSCREENQYVNEKVASENVGKFSVSGNMLSNNASGINDIATSSTKVGFESSNSQVRLNPFKNASVLQRTGNNDISTSSTKVGCEPLPNSQVGVNPFTVKIKQEKQDTKGAIQESASSSSSSTSSESSSSDSSSDEMPNQAQKPPAAKMPVIKTEAKEPVATITYTSPPNIKINSNPNVVNETPSSLISKKEAERAPTPSSSSSSEEELTKPPPTSSKSATKRINTKLEKQDAKLKSQKKKNGSEDDIVCIGNLKNEIVLEDDSDQEAEEAKDTQHDSKNTSKKTEICLICDKKGHTVIQCQMICKNCSEPYHGYRTCPHPANLNTMMQLFLEFCMQNFEHFVASKDLGINCTIRESSQPKVYSPTTHDVNKKIPKRKLSKILNTNTKTKSAKKGEIYGIGKKKDITEDDDAEDNDSVSTSSESEVTTESDDSAPSKRFKSSKKKHKLKNKTLNMPPSFTPNALNLPLVLNGIQNLTAGTSAATNQTAANNTLNSLLLTQMFQNVIGSLK